MPCYRKFNLQDKISNVDIRYLDRDTGFFFDVREKNHYDWIYTTKLGDEPAILEWVWEKLQERI
jgi:hypothetical protein